MAYEPNQYNFPQYVNPNDLTARIPANESTEEDSDTQGDLTEQRYDTPMTEDDHIGPRTDLSTRDNKLGTEASASRPSASNEVEEWRCAAANSGKLIEKLATGFDGSRKPYARETAAELREAQAKLETLVEKLADIEQSTQEHTPEDVLMADAGAEFHRIPSPERAALVADLTEGMTISQSEKLAALFDLKASDHAKQPSPEAQDPFVATRLVGAAAKLLLAENENVMVVGHFIVELCGEGVLQERLKYWLDPRDPEFDDLGTAKSFLQDAAFVIGNFNGQAASRLQGIIRTINWGESVKEGG